MDIPILDRDERAFCWACDVLDERLLYSEDAVCAAEFVYDTYINQLTEW